MKWFSFSNQLWVSTELKVRASPPFVKLENNTGLIVQRWVSASALSWSETASASVLASTSVDMRFNPRGDSGTMCSSNLSTVTNMNIEEVLFPTEIQFVNFYKVTILTFASFVAEMQTPFKFSIKGKHCVQSHWRTILWTSLCRGWGRKNFRICI